MAETQEQKASTSTEGEQRHAGICITNRRNINTKEGSMLSLLYLGARYEDQSNSQAFALSIPTPPAYFSDEQNEYTSKPLDRILIRPDEFGDTSIFMHFLTKLEELFMKAKHLGDRNGFMDCKWYSSVKMEDGIMKGVVCKVKKNEVKEVLEREKGKRLRFILTLNCLWYNDRKGGVSLELTNVAPGEEPSEKKEES